MRRLAAFFQGGNSKTSSLCPPLPRLQLQADPSGIFFCVAQQTGIWTFFLPESLRHPGIGNVVDLVGARSKQKSVHDAWHVTRNAAAAFRVDPVMSMRSDGSTSLKLRMAIRAHEVGLIAKLRRSQIRCRIVSVRIVTVSAAYLPFPEALRALQRFHDECRLTEAPVFVKTDPREFAERNTGTTSKELAKA